MNTDPQSSCVHSSTAPPPGPDDAPPCGPDDAPAGSRPALPDELVRSLNDLRQCLVTATDLSIPYDRFDTHVATPTLLDYSDDRSNPRLLSVLQQTMALIVPGLRIRRTLLLSVPGAGFWHGLAWSRRCLMAFYYFDSIGMGLVGLSHDHRGLGPMNLVRLTVHDAESPATPQ